MTLESSWNTGPTWILSQKSNDSDENCYLLVSPNDDKEIRSEIVSLKICISDPKTRRTPSLSMNGSSFKIALSL
jgi:hypothetical protein